MLTFILVLIIIICLFLTLLVLIQNPKGGIAANFVAPSQIMGVKRSTDIVEKATWVLALALISLSLLSNFFRPDGAGTESINDSRLKNQTEEMVVPAEQRQPSPPPVNGSPNTQPSNAK
ncbi:MAG: preprotein translocase subunit SecG [Bacteroidia bacterium]|nr:preprotein translocase subunit SecG [Bacteroidia bacterium]